MVPVKAAREGSRAAVLKAFDEHHLPLFRFAYRLTGSSADAEDIVQECFLALLRPGCPFDAGRTPLRTYLFGAVRNQWLKRLRRNGTAIPDIPDRADERSPERLILHAEIAGAVAEAIAQLPELQRETLILAHYEQLPLAEIAEITGADLGAVKSRLQRARASLKQMLSAYAPSAEKRQ